MPPSEKNTLCLLGSPRRGGNSDRLAERFCSQAQSYGSTAENVALSALSFSGCQNLFECKNGSQTCGLNDDLSNVLEKIKNAHVLVLASPIYFTNVSGVLKSAIDRFFSFFVPDYTTTSEKSRLGHGRTLVLVQTQGEPEDRYTAVLDQYERGFQFLGFDHQYLIRAWGVREPGDVARYPAFLQQADDVAKAIYSS